MALGWFAVLKLVPWGEVIENAPKVAQGARKLWHSVGKKPLEVTLPTVPQTLPVPTLAALQTQVAELQVAAAELHQQMFESSALIKLLAEQNTELISRVDSHRKRLRWLLALVLGLAVVVLVQSVR